MIRIEELLKTVGNDTATDNKDFIELSLISDLAVDYEEAIMPAFAPTISELKAFRQQLE